MIKYPHKIDLSKFKNTKNFEVKYGLPEEVKFCKNCVISNQRPNSTIEFLNNSKSKKKQLILMMKIYVMHVITLF